MIQTTNDILILLQPFRTDISMRMYVIDIFFAKLTLMDGTRCASFLFDSRCFEVEEPALRRML